MKYYRGDTGGLLKTRGKKYLHAITDHFSESLGTINPLLAFIREYYRLLTSFAVNVKWNDDVPFWTQTTLYGEHNKFRPTPFPCKETRAKQAQLFLHPQSLASSSLVTYVSAMITKGSFPRFLLHRQRSNLILIDLESLYGFHWSDECFVQRIREVQSI